MSMFSPTPVLSVVVPHLGDDASFETSLVSVLENRPRRCEVIVCHDGSYTDPFELGDEVQFVVCPQKDLPTQVLTAAHQAKGRIMHVLANGLQATEGWTEGPVDCFSDETVASVSPAIQHADQKALVALGWKQGSSSICSPVASGKKSATRHDRASVDGAYLNASFWRTDVLQSLERLPTLRQTKIAAAVWTSAAQAVGLRCHSEATSVVLADRSAASRLVTVSSTTARHLQSVAAVIEGKSALRSGMFSWLANIHRVGNWGTAWGRTSAAWSDGSFQQRLRAELPEAFTAVRSAVADGNRPATLPLNRAQPTAPASSAPLRRAA
ncbi:hypothetical protein [Roseimaritima multifibrata]|nr:hypothetical protein [Roseimaritima multifibrata]